MYEKLKFIVFLTASFFCNTYVSAQNTDEIKKEINKIKKDSKYIYAESTANSEEEARLFAEEVLYDEINQWAASQKKMRDKPNLIVNNKKEMWTSLSMPRGSNMFRYFIYVKKSDIIATDNTTMLANESMEQADEKDHGNRSDARMSDVPDVVKEILSYKKYEEMASKIMEMKNSGRIKNYARYASLSNPDVCYLAIYNRQGQVMAILTPGKDRINVETGKPDGVKNYSGCGAIGFEL